MGEAKRKAFTATEIVAAMGDKENIQFEGGVMLATGFLTGRDRSDTIRRIAKFIESKGYVAPDDVVKYLFEGGPLRRRTPESASPEK